LTVDTSAYDTSVIGEFNVIIGHSQAAGEFTTVTMTLIILPNCDVQEWVELEDFPMSLEYGQSLTYVTDGMDQLLADEQGNSWDSICGDTLISVIESNGDVSVNDENDVVIEATETGDFFVVLS